MIILYNFSCVIISLLLLSNTWFKSSWFKSIETNSIKFLSFHGNQNDFEIFTSGSPSNFLKCHLMTSNCILCWLFIAIFPSTSVDEVDLIMLNDLLWAIQFAIFGYYLFYYGYASISSGGLHECQFLQMWK